MICKRTVNRKDYITYAKDKVWKLYLKKIYIVWYIDTDAYSERIFYPEFNRHKLNAKQLKTVSGTVSDKDDC